MSWEQLYDLLGIRDFIYFISSPEVQEALFPIKLVFIFFTIAFLIAVIYFLANSSYIKYQFLEDVVEFFSWQPYGLREIANRWRKIEKRVEEGIESELKLAVIEADDFLIQMIEDRGIEGENFEELIKNAGRTMIPNSEEIMQAHEVRNSIVYNPDYKIDLGKIKKIMAIYESAIKNLGTS